MFILSNQKEDFISIRKANESSPYVLLSAVAKTLHQSTNEPRHEISNNVVCATSKASNQPAHTRSLIRAFASRLNIL